MVPREQIFFTDDSIYITNTRLVLRKGGTYPIANLAQVNFEQVAASRFWISFLIFGFVFLIVGPLLNRNSNLAKYSVLLKGEPYLLIGGVLLLIGLISALFQVVCPPLYVVMLKGTFGTARPIKRRNRRYIIQIVTALNDAISQRNAPSIVQSTTHIGQVIHGLSNSSSGHINIIGPGASGNIHNTSSISNARQSSDGGWPILSPNVFSNEAQIDLHPGGIAPISAPGWTGQPRTDPLHPAMQADQVGQGARKIIISYSHEDQQWLSLLRTHLALLEQRQMIELWDDTQIAAGMQTQQAITDALQAADFALLLVSANFLASQVIMRYELPLILQRLTQKQFSILPLVLAPCLYSESPLGSYQPFSSNSPLSTLSPPNRDNLLVRVAQEIQRAVQ
jgi:TIR domain/Family of unknown function (DUF6232)